ncbi:MAG: molybdate ABC transporter permease subunit [Acidobacteria bacterium]|nr:molybdate ABC transporter permease subunit [Acidobacteriota bacterium]
MIPGVVSYVAAMLLMGQVTTRPEPITVSAAVSLTDALEEIGRAYESAGGGAVRLNFAGSNVLARQIANGAPVDLFISADEAQMDLADQAGAILAGTRIDLLGNQLAVVVSRGATSRDLDRTFPGRLLLETFVSLPLVMPPVATGLILLMLFAPRGPIGRLLAPAGIEVIFTWKAVVLAMTVMGLPLFIRTVRGGFEQVDRRYESVAATLGASPFRVFLTITMPLARPAILAGSVLGFARALGEFGATIMIAGSIPGVTRTLSVAIYSFAETGRDVDAAKLVGVSATIAFAALWLANWISTRAGVRS